MRDILFHDYFGVKVKTVWDVEKPPISHLSHIARRGVTTIKACLAACNPPAREAPEPTGRFIEHHTPTVSSLTPTSSGNRHRSMRQQKENNRHCPGVIPAFLIIRRQLELWLPETE